MSQFEEDVKEPTLLSEINRGNFPGGLVYVAYIIHIMGWVGYSKLITNKWTHSGCQWRPCMLTC